MSKRCSNPRSLVPKVPAQSFYSIQAFRVFGGLILKHALFPFRLRPLSQGIASFLKLIFWNRETAGIDYPLHINFDDGTGPQSIPESSNELCKLIVPFFKNFPSLIKRNILGGP